MSTITCVTKVPEVTHTEHYRETLIGVCQEVFVEVYSPWQIVHEHLFSDLDRSGNAICHGCGAQAWCESWVVAGFMADNTYGWADSLYRAYAERVDQDKRDYEYLKELAADLDHYPSTTYTAIVADLDDSAPALTATADQDVDDDLFDPSM